MTLTARDANGNQEPGGGLNVTLALGGTPTATVTDNKNGTYTATFTPATLGTNAASATIGDQPVTSTATVTVVGTVDLTKSTLTGPTSPMASGTTATVTLVARDALGNREPVGGLTVKFALQSTGAGVASGTFGSVKDNKDGTYTATFTAVTAGINTITATIGGQPVTATAPLTVVPGVVSLSKSTVTLTQSGVPVTSMTSGATATLTLVARDANGNQEGGLAVVFGLAKKAGSGSASGTFSTVTDNGNGTYTTTFTATTAGTNTITATIGGQAVVSKMPAVKVVPGAVDLTQSTVTASPASVVSGVKVTVTLTARDANGNQEPGGGLNVTFSLGAGSTGGTLSAVKDNKNGTYTATFTAAAVGSDTIMATIGGVGIASTPPTVTVTTSPPPKALSLGEAPTNDIATDAALRALLMDESTVTGKLRPLFNS